MKCENCSHAEMCRWIDELEGRGCDFYDNKPCEDAISRESAKKLYCREICSVVMNCKEQFTLDCKRLKKFDKLPSVTQKSETVTEFADRCRECGARYGKLLEQKSGKWIEHPEIETSTPEYLMFYECSECGDKQCFCKSDIHKKRFCSNCGAKMESEDEK